MMPRPSPPPPPPWEALHLIAPLLDAKSLAMASCVSTAWRAAFAAADHLWAQLCLAHYPSSLRLPIPIPNNTTSPHRRLFALFHSASRRAPPKPRLALADIVFAIDLFAGAESALSFAVPGDEAGAKNGPGGVFRFEVDVRERNAVLGRAGALRVGWTVLRKDLSSPPPSAAFAMMTAEVPMTNVGMVDVGWEVWALERLPAPCGGARLEAEVVMEMAGEDEVGRRRGRVEKVRFGVICECRYVGLDEGLVYLQHFLLA